MKHVVYVRSYRGGEWVRNSTWNNVDQANDWATNHMGKQFGWDNVKIERE